VTYLDDDRVESIAGRIRSEMGYSSSPFIDAKTFFFKAKKQLGFSYLWPSVNSTPEYDADKNRISIPLAVISEAEGRHGGRHRMTIFHECAHAFLGHRHVKYRAASGNLAEKYSRTIRKDEQEARRLAAALMAPFNLIDPSWNAHDIALKFGMSLQAAEIRLTQFQEHTRKKSGRPRPLQKNFDDLLAMLEKNEKKKR
jgi:Zn-dependent peptidase ImmA (M78 family)